MDKLYMKEEYIERILIKSYDDKIYIYLTSENKKSIFFIEHYIKKILNWYIGDVPMTFYHRCDKNNTLKDTYESKKEMLLVMSDFEKEMLSAVEEQLQKENNIILL